MVTGVDRWLLMLRRRRRQRGASILIVFLVITMLMGIGMFAARSTTLSTSMAGSSRQLTQTRYFTEYGSFEATASLALDPQKFAMQMPNYKPIPGDPKCYGFAQIPNATCFPRGYKDLETELSVPLVVPADVANKIPGGFGRSDIVANFNVEITELAQNLRPIPGESLGSNRTGGLSFWSLTLTATGQIYPTSTPANLQKILASSASVSSWRAHLTVGPFAAPAAPAPTP
jgi:hypothetical protein